MGQSSDSRKAINDIVDVMKGIFKRYSRTARRRAWRSVTSNAGEKVIQRIINNPGVSTPGLDRLAFKEWLENQTDSEDNAKPASQKE